MNPQTQKLVLALSLGMALAACGGGDGNNTTPESSATTKATPADTSSSEAAPSTTAATQDAATAQNAAGVQNSSAPAQTNEAASDPIQWNDTNSTVTVRGDLVIQALLSQAGPLDAQQQPQVYPLHFEHTGKTAGSGEPSGDMIMLVTADITPDNGKTGLGSNLLELDLARGPAYGPLENARAAPNAINYRGETPSMQFGISQAALPQGSDGQNAPITTPLRIGKTVKLGILERHDLNSTSASVRTDFTMTREDDVVINPKDHLTASGNAQQRVWAQTWRGSNDRAVTLDLDIVAPGRNRFRTCFSSISIESNTLELCTTWEVPAGWTSGQPLKRVGHRLRTPDGQVWNDDSSGVAPVSRESLKKTADPISSNGISGSVLAAMFDAFTPRSHGMQVLPQRAGATDAPHGTAATDHEPPFVSLHQESRASTYADGKDDPGSHSPVTGSYLHVSRAGAWQSASQPQEPARNFAQTTLALHVNSDPTKGLTLPRWMGLTSRDIDEQNTPQWQYQGEQASPGQTAKTIAPDDLLIFGQIVQLWRDPGTYSTAGTTSPKKALVTLTVEQSTANPRSADLCWSTLVEQTDPQKYCTTWTIPQGWQPGQPLPPQSYYAYRRNSRIGGGVFWNTQTGN